MCNDGRLVRSASSKYLDRPWPPAIMVLAVAACLAASFGVANADIEYHKNFYVDEVKPDALIKAGGQAQTWCGSKIEPDTQTIFDWHQSSTWTCKQYRRADTRTRISTLHHGLPPESTGKTASDGWQDMTVAVDDHVQKNSAGVMVYVSPRKVEETVMKTKKGDRTFRQYVQVDLDGSAGPGVPDSGPNHHHQEPHPRRHSADSFSAVQLKGTKYFQDIGDPSTRLLGEVGEYDMRGGCWADPNHDPMGKKKEHGERLDPSILTITDVDTGVSVTEPFMSEEAGFDNGLISLDDNGIRFTIPTNDPNAFVWLNFTTLSDWVQEPYTYGARLDADGLTAWGLTPLSGWQVTTTADAVEAFYPFGPDGLLADYALLQPPEDLFTPGHSYQYDVGTGDGAWDAVSPEPTTLALLAMGVLTMTRRRR